MKKFLLIAILFFGCEKENNLVTTAILVVETDSSIPLNDATVVFFRCNFGCPFGPTILFEGVTDNNGIVEVPSEHYNDSTSMMNVIKLNYWPFLVEKTTTASLTPEGWIQLQIHKVGNYPVDSKLLLNLLDHSGTRSDLTEYNTSTDSIIFIKSFGGQLNKIDWQVVDENFDLLNNGTLKDLQVPKFDTLKNITLNY
jgi:hypothetical protein